MPRYKVTAPGFFNGEYYHPEGKRKVLSTDKPFPKKKLPSWLIAMPPESEVVKKKREQREEAEQRENENMVSAGHKDISEASSTGDGKEASFLSKTLDKMTGKSSNVETL